MIGEKLSPILLEIEETIIEFDAEVGNKPNYDNEALRSATKIFMSVMMDKMFELQMKEEMTLEVSCDMADKLGNELRVLIKKYADVDTFEFYKAK